jgi:hypothetical protein
LIPYQWIFLFRRNALVGEAGARFTAAARRQARIRLMVLQAVRRFKRLYQRAVLRRPAVSLISTASMSSTSMASVPGVNLEALTSTLQQPALMDKISRMELMLSEFLRPDENQPGAPASQQSSSAVDELDRQLTNNTALKLADESTLNLPDAAAYHGGCALLSALQTDCRVQLAVHLPPIDELYTAAAPYANSYRFHKPSRTLYVRRERLQRGVGDLALVLLHAVAHSRGASSFSGEFNALVRQIADRMASTLPAPAVADEAVAARLRPARDSASVDSQLRSALQRFNAVADMQHTVSALVDVDRLNEALLDSQVETKHGSVLTPDGNRALALERALHKPQQARLTAVARAGLSTMHRDSHAVAVASVGINERDRLSVSAAKRAELQTALDDCNEELFVIVLRTSEVAEQASKPDATAAVQTLHRLNQRRAVLLEQIKLLEIQLSAL